MNEKRKVEIFSADCAACKDTVALVRELACSSCEVIVQDMNQADVARRARELGIRSVPAVVIDGKLASCCAAQGVDRAALQEAGVGQAA